MKPIEGGKVLDRTPQEGSGWNQYTIEGFSVGPLLTTDGSRCNPLSWILVRTL